MAGTKHETVFDLSNLFEEINSSFTQAALKLHRIFQEDDWVNQPYVYHMPRMHMSISLELSHSDGRVKGVFRKSSTERTETLSSRIEVDVVSVPKSTGNAAQSA